MVSRKVIPLLLSFIYYSSISYSQDLNLALQSDFFSFAKVVVPAGQGKWLIGGETGRFYGFPSFSPYLVMIDEEGHILWERDITNVLGTEEGWVSHIIPQKTETFLVIGEVQGCDYGLPGFIAEYDSLGNQLSFIENWGPGEIISPLPNGDLLVGNKDWSNFGRVDIREGLVWERQLYQAYQLRLKDLEVLNDAQAYVLGEKWLFKIDPEEGEILKERRISNGKDLLVLPSSSELLFLDGTKIDKYDADLNLIQTLTLEAEIQYYYLKEIGGKVYALGRNTARETIVKIIDEALNPIRIFPAFDRYHLVNDLAMQQHEIIMVGNEIVKDYEGEIKMHYSSWPYALFGSQIFVQTFDTLGQKAPNPLDIALVDIEMEAAPEVQNLGYNCRSLGFSSISVKVENTGTETLHSLALNSRYDRCQAICRSAFTYHYVFDDLALEPGESISLPLGNLSAPGIPDDDEIELCIWLSIPNQKSDNKGSNNLLCQSFIINGNHEADPSFDIQLFPNPTSAYLQVDFKQPLASQENGAIFNVSGQVLQTFPFDKGSQGKTLDLSSLAAGTYFLKIGEYSARFVKN